MNHSSALKHSSGGTSSACFPLNRAERGRTGPNEANCGCTDPAGPRSRSFRSHTFTKERFCDFAAGLVCLCRSLSGNSLVL